VIGDDVHVACELTQKYIQGTDHSRERLRLCVCVGGGVGSSSNLLAFTHVLRSGAFTGVCASAVRTR
jgi:hypothetical protein